MENLVILMEYEKVHGKMHIHTSISILNNAIIQKHTKSNISNSLKSYELAKLLNKSGYINDCDFFYRNMKITFNIYRDENILNKILPMYKPSYRSGIKYKKLKRFKKKKNKIYILSGNRGINYSDTYIKYKSGGNLLADLI